MSEKTLSLLNTLGFILVITMNALANALPINGRTTGELSALYPNLFVPAGFTFSIWGLIYFLLLAFIIYQARLLWQKNIQIAEVRIIGIWFFISCLANASWILAWHYLQVELSVLIMLTLLTSLIMIYRRLQIGRPVDSWQRRYFVHLPFSVYLGWITVATIANTTTLLVDWGLSGFLLGETNWTVLMITIATLFGLFFLWKRQDIAYALVLIWAIYGISAARYNDLIVTTTYVSIALLGIGVIWRAFRPGAAVSK